LRFLFFKTRSTLKLKKTKEISREGTLSCPKHPGANVPIFPDIAGAILSAHHFPLHFVLVRRNDGGRRGAE
jgi:hypothetical protein